MLGRVAALNLTLAPTSTQPTGAKKGGPSPPPLSQLGRWLPRAMGKPVNVWDIEGLSCHHLLGTEDLEKSLSLSHTLQSQGMTSLESSPHPRAPRRGLRRTSVG